MGLLQTENEDNGVLCMKILTSLHRAYKTHLYDQVQPFLDLVIEMYKNIPQVVKDLFNYGSGTGNTPSGQQPSSSSGTPPFTTSFQSPRPLSPTTSSDFSVESSTTKTLQRSMYSFKVLTECPIIIVLLYSTHKNLANQSLPGFIPHIIEMLSLQAAPQARAHAAAEAKGEIYTSVSPQIKNKTAYGEFIVAQVKTMSFLAYALRGFASSLEKYHKMIPDFVVRLLQDCPCELSAARKELLVATRHILSTDFRTIFIPKVDILLNEKVLIGDGLTVHETLRPLAYSTMADLVHHVRGELTPEQIVKTVRVYCKNMQDDTLATNFQIMSAKLLLNLVERIMKLKDKNEGRQIMVLILNAFVERFSSLNKSYSHIMKKHKRAMNSSKRTSEGITSTPITSSAIPATTTSPLHAQTHEDNAANRMDIDEEHHPDGKPADHDHKEEELDNKVDNNNNSNSNNDDSKDGDDNDDNDKKMHEKEEEDKEELDFFDILDDGLIKIHPDTGNNDLKDARYIFKNLMNFLKTVMFGLKSCNPPPPTKYFNEQQWQESARVFNYEQITIFRRLFREGIAGHLFFCNPESSVEENMRRGLDMGSSNMLISSSKDEKELMEAFATVFIHIDPASFNEIVDAELPFLYDSMFKNPALLHIPQFFLASEATSANFSGLLISFLKDKLPELGDGDYLKSNILIRLFKLCFMAVNLFPSANETVILPHLRDLIIGSMELNTTAKDPIIYFNLLRTLFRSIGGGRFELLYKEVLPLLQVLLESLNKLLATARKPQERDIYVELCLTVPVRLSVLVPHLSYLMRPLVIALNGSQELVSQGLRTLELCVDNLTAEYFDPIIEPVIGEVMEALWKHLKPLPYYHQHSHTTFRVLGKLGGRNRRFLTPPSNLRCSSTHDQDMSVELTFGGLPEKKPVKITPGITSAKEVLGDQQLPLHYRKKAYEYLATVMKLIISPDDNLDEGELGGKIRDCIDVILSQEFPQDDEHLPDGKVDAQKKKIQNELVEGILESIFTAVTIPELKDDVMTFLKDIAEHFTILELGEVVLEKRKAQRAFDLDEHEGIGYVDPKTLLSSVMFALSHYNPKVKEAGQQVIHYTYEAGLSMFGSNENVHKFPLFRAFFGKLSHTCFEQEYYRKAGACLGMKTVIKDLDLPLTWIKPRQLEFVRTMFFVLKDVPSDVPNFVKTDASELLYHVLNQINKDLTEEQIKDRPFKQLTGLLAYELGNANQAVRDTSKKCLSILSEVTGKTTSELLMPVKTILLTPIFGKPLRALPFPMQIGHIDAITYCLGLKTPILEYNDELTRLILEALQLVDAEDESLTSAHRVFEYSTAEQLIQLRIVCIQLLSLALTTPDYSAIQQGQTKGKIIAVFFKTLYSRSSKVVDAAHKGLAAVLSQNAKLPKDLLQNGLRPILVNLSDHKRLTVPGLEGLARLLELLTSYFKVEIGNKLLDHLNAWAEPSQLQSNSIKTLSSQQNIRIITEILNIFHLLPEGAHCFMKGIMDTIFHLEHHLRRQQTSPFREPVAKFLNRYPEKAFEYFLPKISERRDGRFFASILTSKSATKLREYTRENVEKLQAQIGEQPTSEQKCVAICNMIYVIQALNSDDPEWILSQKKFLDDINSSSADMMETATTSTPGSNGTQVGGLTSQLYLQVEQSLSELQNVFVSYFIATKGQDIDMVFSVVNVLCSSGIKVNFGFMEYIFNNVISSYEKDIRKAYLMKSIDMASSKSYSVNTRTFVLRNIINPILIMEGHRSGDLNSLLEKCTGTAKGSTWLDAVHSKIWRPQSPDSTSQDENIGTIDHCRFELLQMSSLLIKLSPNLVADARKDIIKFGWNYIKLEDIVSKQTAYVLIAYFIAAYDTLSKIVVQIYVALLKTHQNEAKNLVKQALDLLAPVLPKRVNSPLWAKWPRRVLSEDGHNVTQVVNIYQFVVRHPELFFEYRDHFIPNIISALPKLSFVSNASSENQVLAVDLAELVLKWERMAKSENSTAPDDMETDEKMKEDGQTEKIETIQQNYTVPFAQREALVTYLIRFVCVSPHKAAENALGQRIIKILYELLGTDYWHEVTVKLTFFERSLVHNDLSNQNSLAICLNALEVIALTLERKTSSWIVSNIHHLERLLEKSVRSDSSGKLLTYIVMGSYCSIRLTTVL